MMNYFSLLKVSGFVNTAALLTLATKLFDMGLHDVHLGSVVVGCGIAAFGAYLWDTNMSPKPDSALQEQLDEATDLINTLQASLYNNEARAQEIATLALEHIEAPYPTSGGSRAVVKADYVAARDDVKTQLKYLADPTC